MLEGTTHRNRERERGRNSVMKRDDSKKKRGVVAEGIDGLYSCHTPINSAVAALTRVFSNDSMTLSSWFFILGSNVCNYAGISMISC